MRPLRSLLLALALAAPASANELLPAATAIPDAVDHYLDAQLAEQNIKPAAAADDLTVVRRLTLDLAGRIPTAAEAAAYAASRDADNKLKLVERLMASGAYARHTAHELDALLAAAPLGRRGGQPSLRGYLSAAARENRPWDKVFRDLVTGGDAEAQRLGAGNFLRPRARDLDKLTTEVSALFFGVNISCAQCHDHPLVADWKQDHYYGLKSFFASTYEAGANVGEREPTVVQFKTTKNLTRTAKLMFLTGDVSDIEVKAAPPPGKRQAKAKKDDKPAPPKVSARAALVELALKPGARDFLARAAVNRTWQRLFGLGLVTPADQMHSANPPSHPELLAWLARDFVANGYDLKRLVRGLVLSRAYARSSEYEGPRHPPARAFAVARLRALTPAQMALSLKVATASPEQFPADLKADELDRRLAQLEASSAGIAAGFEQPRDDFQIGVAEALLFSNNEQLERELLGEGRDRLLGRVKEAKEIEGGIELVVRNVLTRPPTAEEKKALVAYVNKRQGRLGEAYRQVIWALLGGAEFRFNY